MRHCRSRDVRATGYNFVTNLLNVGSAVPGAKHRPVLFHLLSSSKSSIQDSGSFGDEMLFQKSQVKSIFQRQNGLNLASQCAEQSGSSGMRIT